MLAQLFVRMTLHKGLRVASDHLPAALFQTMTEATPQK